MSYYKRNLTFFAHERGDGRFGFWWIAGDSDEWQAAKDDLRLSFNHSTGLRYDAVEREWTIPRYSVDRLQRWVDAWASRQEWNAEPRHGQRRSSGRAQDAPVASIADAYATLHLLPTAPPEVVQAAHRALVKTNHPDAGGTHEAAVAINAAIARIRDYAAGSGAA